MDTGIIDNYLDGPYFGLNGLDILGACLGIADVEGTTAGPNVDDQGVTRMAKLWRFQEK